RRVVESRHALQEPAGWRIDADAVHQSHRFLAVSRDRHRAGHDDRIAAAAAPVARAGSGMNGAEHICELLSELGVSHVFGLPGTQNVLLYEALRTRRLRSTSASDEGD